MPTYTTTIACPIERAFYYHAEYERHPEWQPELVEARITTPRPVGVGSRGYELRRVGPTKVRMNYEITEHDPLHVTAFRALDGPTRPWGRVTFSEVPEGTRVDFEADLGLRGPAKLAAPLANAVFGRQVRRHIENLKEILEGDGG